mmetsp:Transcript_8286/g.12354  ORF Transcript_8286/g.12354 Transcript_8286/m.12354 type:complete len:192 (+) Transcript_8286:5-580(+)
MMDGNNKSPLTLPDFGNIDVDKLRPAYGLPSTSGKHSGPEFIPYNTRGRDVFGRLSFNTGVFWVSGYTFGGCYGLVEGWKAAASPHYLVRFNSVMNSFSRRGTNIGNALGTIAFLHTAFVGLADAIEIERLTGQTVSTPIFAGFLTGGLYKSGRGPRAAALASVIGASASTVYWYTSSYVSNVLLGRKGRF